MTSFYEPDPATLDLFDALKPLGQVVRKVDVQTRRLDEIDEIERLDFLKIDILGGKLAVFRGGRYKLASTVAVQTEVSFVTLYKDQPTLGDVDVELRQQGFVPHRFAAIKKWPIAPCVVNGDPHRALNPLLEADLMYVRDFAHPQRMSDEQLEQLANDCPPCIRLVRSGAALRCRASRPRRSQRWRAGRVPGLAQVARSKAARSARRASCSPLRPAARLQGRALP